MSHRNDTFWKRLSVPDESISKEFKAILATRDQNASDAVARVLAEWPLLYALKFIRQFRILYPHTSTSPYELEHLIETELRRKELAPCVK